jgi:iron(III) transport system substrate-binding protein
MSRWIRPPIVLLAAMLLVVAAACGDDTETADPDPTTTTEAAVEGTCRSEGISTEELDLTKPGVAAEGTAVSFSPDPALRGTTLTLYTGRDQKLLGPLVEEFTRLTGVQVDVRYGTSAEMGAQILEEGKATPADVFYSQEVGAVGLLAREGLLTELPTDIVERAQPRFRPKGDPLWVGVTGRSRVIVYNPDLLEEVPRCVEALTDPKYRGKVAIVPANAGFQAFVTGFRVSRGEDEARKWLEQMVANEAVTTIESNGDVLEAVNNGDVPLGLINHYYWARHENRDQLKAQLIFPGGDDPGGLVNATAVGITTSGKDNPAALAFVDFLTSKEGQTFFVEKTWEYPVVGGVPGPQGMPALAELEGPGIDLADLDSLEKTQQLLTDVGLDIG